VVVYKEAYTLSKKEHSTRASNPVNLSNGTLPPPSMRTQLLDEDVFLVQLHRAASVLNPGFQAAVLERICDHLYTSIPEALVQGPGGSTQADTFFRDADLFQTECIFVDPSIDQPPLTVKASLCWQDVSRSLPNESDTTLTAVCQSTFSRAKSAGHEARLGPASWLTHDIAFDTKHVGANATAMMRRRAVEASSGISVSVEPGEACGAGSLGFTRSRSAPDVDDTLASGKLFSSSWDVNLGGLLTRSR
jgi:hypothetical protein